MNKIMPIGVLIFLLSMQNSFGNVAYKRLIESLIKNQAPETGLPSQAMPQTTAQNMLYKEQRVDDTRNKSNVVVAIGTEAFHSVILNYSLQQLVVVKFHNDNDLDSVKTYQSIADTFADQALFVSVNIGNNAANKDLLIDIEGTLGLDPNIELPLYLFCKDRKLLMPIRHGGYNQETMEAIIRQYLEFLMTQPMSQGIQSSNPSGGLYTKNNRQLPATLRRYKKSIWKKNSELYKKFNAIF